MKKICLKLKNMNIEDKKSKRRIMQCIAGIEGVSSVAVDTKERFITVIGDTDRVSLCDVLEENGFSPEFLSVGPAREERKVGWDTENRGRNPYLGMQRTEAVGGFGGVNRAIEDRVGIKTRIVEVVAGFGCMNHAIADSVGSKTSIMEVVAGFGDLTSIKVDLKEGMVTVVGKSVPVSVALKVREMGYRAKLLSLGPATEEEDEEDAALPQKKKRIPRPATELCVVV